MRLKRVGQWSDGKKVGVWRMYAKDTVLNEATYVDGELQTMVAFQPDGRPLVRASYRKGLAHGEWTRWNKDGLVVERFYEDGRRSGTWRRHGTEPETKV
jgi:antitoxin component YwqK of YwqJK toxin-antitoxin module